MNYIWWGLRVYNKKYKDRDVKFQVGKTVNDIMMKSCDSLIDHNYDFELNFNIQDNTCNM